MRSQWRDGAALVRLGAEDLPDCVLVGKARDRTAPLGAVALVLHQPADIMTLPSPLEATGGAAA